MLETVGETVEKSKSKEQKEEKKEENSDMMNWEDFVFIELRVSVRGTFPCLFKDMRKE